MGYGIGSIADFHTIGPPFDSTRLSAYTGDHAEVLLRDGNAHAGTLLGTGELTDAEYRIAHRRWHAVGRFEATLPVLGQRVTAVDASSGTTTSGMFNGYASGGIVIGDTVLALTRVGGLEDSVGALDIRYLQRSAASGGLPARSGLIVEDRFGVRIALDPGGIRAIDVNTGWEGRIAGTFVGVLLDGLVIHGVASLFEDFRVH
jgi:hypothetical protein